MVVEPDSQQITVEDHTGTSPPERVTYKIQEEPNNPTTLLGSHLRGEDGYVTHLELNRATGRLVVAYDCKPTKPVL